MANYTLSLSRIANAQGIVDTIWPVQPAIQAVVSKSDNTIAQGSVTFTVNGTSLAPITLPTGSPFATLQLSGLQPGTASITATFNGASGTVDAGATATATLSMPLTGIVSSMPALGNFPATAGSSVTIPVSVTASLMPTTGSSLDQTLSQSALAINYTYVGQSQNVLVLADQAGGQAAVDMGAYLLSQVDANIATLKNFFSPATPGFGSLPASGQVAAVIAKSFGTFSANAFHVGCLDAICYLQLPGSAPGTDPDPRIDAGFFAFEMSEVLQGLQGGALTSCDSLAMGEAMSIMHGELVYPGIFAFPPNNFLQAINRNNTLSNTLSMTGANALTLTEDFCVQRGTLILSGTWTGTIALEYQASGSGPFKSFPVTSSGGGSANSSSLTTNDTWTFFVNDFVSQFRVRVNGIGTGTATVSLVTSADSISQSASNDAASANVAVQMDKTFFYWLQENPRGTLPAKYTAAQITQACANAANNTPAMIYASLTGDLATNAFTKFRSDVDFYWPIAGFTAPTQSDPWAAAVNPGPAPAIPASSTAPQGSVTLTVGSLAPVTQALSNGSTSFTVNTAGLANGTYPITAQYLGNGFTTLATATGTLTITGGGNPNITGNVSLALDGASSTQSLSTIGSSQSSSAFVFKAGTLTIGTHQLAANYLGDTNYSASAAPAGSTLTITGVATITTISANSVNYPADVTGTITVVSSPAGTPIPNGDTVTLTIGGVSQTLTLTNGSANFDVPGLAAGSYIIQATFPQQGGLLASSASKPVTVAANNPTGNVNLTIDSGPPITQPLVNGSTAYTFKAGTLAVGVHPLTATYLGDANFTGSTAPPASLTITGVSTSLSISAPPITFPANALVTVTINPSAASGQVSLSVDGVGVPAQTLVNGSTTFTLIGLTAGNHNLVANYAQQGGYLASSATATQVVNGAGVTITIAAPTVIYPANAQVTLTVTPAAAPGNILLAIDGNPATSQTLTSGQAIFTYSGLQAGVHNLVATYPAQGNFASGGPTTGTVTVQPATTSLTITAPTNVVFPATVQAVVVVSSAGGIPGGNVSLSVDGGPSIIQALTNGETTFSIAGLAAGRHTLTATYAQQGNFGAARGSANLTVGTAQENMTISAPNVAYPADALINVTLTSNAGIVPGQVTLSVDGGPVTTHTLANGQTTFDVPGLAVGTHNFLVNYLGQGSFAPQSQTGTVTITGSGTTLNIGAPTVTWPADALITLTVTSTGGTPTGPVSLSVDGGMAMVLTLVNGTATFDVPGLSAGPHTLAASYPGQGQFLPTSAAANVSVLAAPTSTTVTVSASSSAQPVQFKVTVSSSVVGMVPSGTVTLSYGTAQVQLALTNGQATTSASLAAGSYTATATYPGQGNFAASTGSTTFSVQGNDTTTAVSISPANPVFGQTVTASVTVTSGPGLGSPTGQITLSVDGAALPPQTVVNGATVFSLTGLSVGEHSVTAVYTPADQTFLPSQASTSFLVAGVPTSISINAPNINFGSDEQVTVTVSSPGGTPTGLVSLSLDSGPAQSAQLLSGSATFDLGTTLTVGPHSVTATYGNQGNFATAPPATANFTVGGVATMTSVAATDEQFGTPIPITVTVTAGSGATPIGRVSITVDNSITQSAVLSAAGTASFSVPGLPVGQHTVTGSYAGGGGFLSSVSAPATFNVTGGIATTMKVTAPDTPFPKDEFVTVTVTPASGPPVSGNLIYSVDGGAQAQVSFGGGVGSIRISGLAVGSHTINVDFPTTPTWAESTGSATFRITRGCGCTKFNGASWQVTPSISQSCYWFKLIDEHHKIEVYRDSPNQQFVAKFSFPGLDQTNCPPAIYTAPEGNFKCCGQTTFAFLSGGGGCNGLPSTVTIDTSGNCDCGQTVTCKCGSCLQCGSSWPDHWLYIAGTTTAPANFSGACAGFNPTGLTGLICQDTSTVCSWTGAFTGGGKINIALVGILNKWVATFTDASGHTIQYSLATSAWTCSAPNVLTLQSNQSTCLASDLPPSITLTPANSNCSGQISCPPCPSAPATVHLTFTQSNLPQGTAGDCACLYGTVIPLKYNAATNQYEGQLTFTAANNPTQCVPGPFFFNLSKTATITAAWQCTTGLVGVSIELDGGQCGSFTSTLKGTCSPLNLTASGLWVDRCTSRQGQTICTLCGNCSGFVGENTIGVQVTV